MQEHEPTNPRANLDEVIESNVLELDRLARFYRQRGDINRAREIAEVAEQIRNQMLRRELKGTANGS